MSVGGNEGQVGGYECHGQINTRKEHIGAKFSHIAGEERIDNDKDDAGFKGSKQNCSIFPI